MSSRLGRIGLGVSSAALGQVLSAVQAVALLPLFLRGWGVDTYGRWCSLTAFTSYFGLLDLGGQSYIGNVLAMHAAEGNWNDFEQKLSEGVSLFLALGVFASLVLASLTFFALHLPVPVLGRPLEIWEAVAGGSQAVNFLLLAIPGGIYSMVYRAVGKFTRSAMIGNLFRLASVVASVVLLCWPVGPLVYALSMLAVGAGLTAYLVVDSRRVIPECRKIRIGLGLARRGWSKFSLGAWHFWLIAIAQSVNQQGIVLIIAAFLTPQAVATYTTHRTLASIPGFVSALIQGPVFPELSGLWARKQMEELRRWTVAAIRVVALVTILAGLVVWVAAPAVYPLWTGRQLDTRPVLLGILIGQAILASGWSTGSWSMLAANHHLTVARWWLANALVTLVAASWLVGKFDLVGAAAGSLLGDLGCGVLVFPLLISQFLAVRTSLIYREVLGSLLPVVPGAVLALLAKTICSGWWSLVAFGGALMILAYPLVHLALGKTDVRRLMQTIALRKLC